jgi:hypothetical protein
MAMAIAVSTVIAMAMSLYSVSNLQPKPIGTVPGTLTKQQKSERESEETVSE